MTQSLRFLDFSPHFNTPGFTAGFSVKNFSKNNTDDRTALAEALHLSPSKLVIPKQTHSNHVSMCTNIGRVDDTDGIISDKAAYVLSIQVADCIPLFFLEADTGRFGLIHAGWRGIQKGIIEKSVTFFKPNRVTCLLGPSIQFCCFEIGPEVASLFPKAAQKKGEGDRSFLNLQEAVIRQLSESGVPENQIISDGTCTKCNPEKFHSYRRNGSKAGRHIAIAGWR